MSLDPDQIQKRFDRITEIFSGIVEYAQTSSLSRCPYRNADDLCTALFKCRNQEVDESKPGVLSCGHNGTFDYRPAWESSPRAWDRMNQKAVEIKKEASIRRKNSC
jgi:hypothetical protein